MRGIAFEKRLMALEYVPDRYMTRDICGKVVEANPYILECVLHQCKAKKCVKKQLKKSSMSLEYVTNR